MCEIETVCLMYGIFNLLATSLGLVGALGGIIYVNCIIAAAENQTHDPQGVAVAVSVNVALAAMLCGLLIPFAFSIVLVKGVVQKKATHVKVYFCYTVITKALALLGVLIAVFAGQIEWQNVLILATICASYGIVLRMIYQTYKKIELSSQYDRSKLIEQKC